MEILKSAPVKVFTLSRFLVIYAKINIQRDRFSRQASSQFLSSERQLRLHNDGKSIIFTICRAVPFHIWSGWQKGVPRSSPIAETMVLNAAFLTAALSPELIRR